MKTLVFETTELNKPIRVFQTGEDEFMVQYGEQTRELLSRKGAARVLGEYLIEALTETLNDQEGKS